MAMRFFVLGLLVLQTITAAAPPFSGRFPQAVTLDADDSGRAAPPIPGCYPCDADEQ